MRSHESGCFAGVRLRSLVGHDRLKLREAHKPCWQMIQIRFSKVVQRDF